MSHRLTRWYNLERPPLTFKILTKSKFTISLFGSWTLSVLECLSLVRGNPEQTRDMFWIVTWFKNISQEFAIRVCTNFTKIPAYFHIWNITKEFRPFKELKRLNGIICKHKIQDKIRNYFYFPSTISDIDRENVTITNRPVASCLAVVNLNHR